MEHFHRHILIAVIGLALTKSLRVQYTIKMAIFQIQLKQEIKEKKESEEWL